MRIMHFCLMSIILIIVHFQKGKWLRFVHVRTANRLLYNKEKQIINDGMLI